MELMGEVAEEKELTGNENLAELVNIFTEEKAVLAGEMFSQVRGSIRETITTSQDKLKCSIGRLVSEVPLPSQEKDIEAALNSLVEDYICLEMGLRYDRVSPQLFELKRKIECKVRQYSSVEGVDVVIPLFAEVDFGKSSWKLENACDFDGKEYSVNIEAKVPPITRVAKEKAKQARADYMEICSRALREKLIGDILLKNPSSIAKLDLRTYWIPSPSELEIEIKEVNKDPILVANVYSRHYLVTAWNVEGEESFEHYVREFTEEKARG